MPTPKRPSTASAPRASRSTASPASTNSRHRNGLLRQRAQILAQNLADRRLRQGCQKAHLLGYLVGDHLAPAMRDHGLLGQRCARGLDHEQPYGLTGALVRHADAGAFRDALTGRGNCFDLVRIDVKPRDDDHVLLAVDDPEKAALVENADIAGAKIAVWREGQRIGLRIA